MKQIQKIRERERERERDRLLEWLDLTRPDLDSVLLKRGQNTWTPQHIVIITITMFDYNTAVIGGNAHNRGQYRCIGMGGLNKLIQ